VEFSENVSFLEPSATLALAARARGMKAAGRSVVDLSAGEPLYGTPAHAAEGGIEAIRAGRTGYPPTPGVPELREAIAGYLAETTAASPEPGRILVSAGVKQALFNCVFTLFGPGDEVLVPTPCWTSYLPQVRLARAEPVRVDRPWEDGFQLDVELLEAHRTSRTKGLILNSPGNPSGTVFPADRLREIAEWADRHGVWLLSDEIYRRLHFGEGSAPSLLDLDPPPERSVVFEGVSKALGMTGWRIGFAVGPESVVGKASDVQSQTTSGAATPSQHAAARAYGDADGREETIRENLSLLAERRAMGREILRETPGLESRLPAGGMFFFVRVEGGRSSAELAEELLVEAGVATVPGEAFASPGYLRLNFGVELEDLKEGLIRIQDRLARTGQGEPR